MSPTPSYCRIAALCLALVLAAGCGGPNDRVEVTESRTVSTPDPLPDPEVSAMERFGFRPRVQPAMDAPEIDAGFRWKTPDGWRERGPTAFRAANFVFGPDDEGECYLTVLPGGGGGLTANINRWRDQMSLEPMDEAAIAELPVVSVLGEEGILVEMQGTYRGMGGDRYDEDYGLAGVLAMVDGTLLTVKLTAPIPAMREELDNMAAFVESLEVDDAALQTHDHDHDHYHGHSHDHGHGHSHDHDYEVSQAPDDDSMPLTSPDSVPPPP